MIKIGDKVKFYPFREYEEKNLDPNELTVVSDPENSEYFVEEVGTVIEIHDDHNWFRVEYGDPGYQQKICFHFCDIGKSVWKVEEDKADE